MRNLTSLTSLSGMRDTYSLYEAKAKLSAIIRRVREGHQVIVTLHGKPVVEMRPVSSSSGGIASRMDSLAERGILVRPARRGKSPRAVVRRPGALKRFIAERD